ncbi:MAG: hypothetical protein GIKADHBN_01485 [Phycisphaerales bacterium]|nr:hypothetical protein [Phycisphaerales bacterium]
MAEEFIRKKIKWATKRRRGGSRVWKSKIVKVRKKTSK